MILNIVLIFNSLVVTFSVYYNVLLFVYYTLPNLFAFFLYIHLYITKFIYMVEYAHINHSINVYIFGLNCKSNHVNTY